MPIITDCIYAVNMEVKPQKIIVKEAGFKQVAISNCINGKFSGRENCCKKMKIHWDNGGRIVKQSPLKSLEKIMCAQQLESDLQQPESMAVSWT